MEMVKMETVRVDPAKCRGDGLCVDACPAGALEMGPDELPRVAEDRDSQCLQCGHCVVACPRGALATDKFGPDDCEDLHPGLRVSAAQITEYFKARRSVRCYRTWQPPRDVVLKILNAARWAPTTRNSQRVEWLAIESPPEIRRLAELTIEFWRPYEAMDGLVQLWYQGQDPILREAPLVLVAHAPVGDALRAVDCIIALSHVELLAPAYSLGACWAGLFMAAIKGSLDVRQALHLPEGHVAHGAMMLGYPGVRFRRIPPRRELQVQWR